MRTSYRAISQAIGSLLFLAMLAGPLAPAQTLAHRGWAGSGLAAEAWWHNAVFYRLDVVHFQDSDGDGIGDLHGLAQRMDYLQALGVDAVVLTCPFAEAPFDDAGFEALLREASGRHIRIVIGLDLYADTSSTLAAARQWLTRGAAGVYMQRGPTGITPSETSGLLHDLRTLVDSFPGQRVVLSEPLSRIASPSQGPRSTTAQLTDVPLSSGPDMLRRELSDTQALPESAALLLTDAQSRSASAFFAQDAQQRLGRNKVLATVLLGFQGAVSLRYGQELGLAAEAGGDHPRTMQWTPANVTIAKPEEAKPLPPADPNVFGPYVPYVPPKKATGKPAPDIVADANALRGFTSGVLTEASAKTNREAANVALEDADPDSLLNFYRRLVQLHHGNPSIRNGRTYILSDGTASALVWVRRAPVGALTAGDVIVACNLSGVPLTLSLRQDLQRLHLRSGLLRPLLASWTESPIAQDADHIVLPPYSVFIGQLARAGR